MRNCDHNFIIIHDVYKAPPRPKISARGAGSMSDIAVDGLADSIRGKRVVCAYCGHTKDIYADGEIIVIKKEE